MAANFFKFLNNKSIHSQKDFIAHENNDAFSSMNYYPSFFGSKIKAPLIIRDKVFSSISFKDTTIKNVNFINCVFYDCLFIGSVLIGCEFIDCRFFGTNTHKIKIRNCLINPKQFDNNFELEYDANIAVGLFQELYKNSRSEEQPKYSNESLYQMNVALGFNLDYKLKAGKISLPQYCIKKTTDSINRFFTGYGLKIGRILASVLTIIFLMSFLNLKLKDGFTSNLEIKNFIDAFYFTCVTITTLGYGDITPITTMTKIVVIIESLFGFLFMSLFVSAFINRVLRA